MSNFIRIAKHTWQGTRTFLDTETQNRFWSKVNLLLFLHAHLTQYCSICTLRIVGIVQLIQCQKQSHEFNILLLKFELF